MTNDKEANYETVKARLDQIVDEVGDDSISLDDALELYEEAIKLGLQVSSLLEEGIAAEEIQAAIDDENGERESKKDFVQEAGSHTPQEHSKDEAAVVNLNREISPQANTESNTRLSEH